MYSTRSSLPFGIKPVGLGAALIVNGALLTAIYLFIAPNIGPIFKEPTLIGEIIPEDKPPPPDPPKQKEKQVSQEHPIYAPDPLVKPDVSPNPIRTSPDVVDKPPPIDLGQPKGEDNVTREPPPPPVPPLVVAQIDPRYASAFQPTYPPSEISRERDGTVSIRVLIGTDGRVKAVEQLSATSPAFFEATKRQALGRWRFKPASRGGTPEESWKVMNVRFEMKNL
jgi:periplasmic protein TonB